MTSGASTGHLPVCAFTQNQGSARRAFTCTHLAGTGPDVFFHRYLSHPPYYVMCSLFRRTCSPSSHLTRATTGCCRASWPATTRAPWPRSRSTPTPSTRWRPTSASLRPVPEPSRRCGLRPMWTGQGSGLWSPCQCQSTATEPEGQGFSSLFVT